MAKIKSDGPPNPLPDDAPQTIAAAYLQRMHRATVKWESDASGCRHVLYVEPGRLRHWNNTFYEFRGFVYSPLPVDVVRSELRCFMALQKHKRPGHAPAYLRVTRSSGADALGMVRAYSQACVDQLPSWLDEGRPAANSTAAFRNGILDVVRAFEDPRTRLIPSTESWFSDWVFPFEVESFEPGWDKSRSLFVRTTCGRPYNFMLPNGGRR